MIFRVFCHAAVWGERRLIGCGRSLTWHDEAIEYLSDMLGAERRCCLLRGAFSRAVMSAVINWRDGIPRFRSDRNACIKISQESDAVNKVRLPDLHDKIDSIEHLLTSEAFGQIGFGIDGGIKFFAQGTLKAKSSMPVMGGDIQPLLDQQDKRDFVTQ
jgi:hypothetical protein